MSAPRIIVPAEIEMALEMGATLVISISGGKDSQAMLCKLPGMHAINRWPGTLFALHMDLGRAEWKQTPAFVERIASENGVPLIVTRRPQGDLVQEIEDRMHKLRGTERPFWPSSAARYCTADQKRSQADRVYRDPDAHLPPFWPSSASRYCTAHQKTNQADKVYRNHEIIISAEGIRSQESPARAKKSPVSIRSQITAKSLRDLPIVDALRQKQPGQRVAINWFPIFDWTLEEVWEGCGTSLDELRRRQALYRDGREEEALEGWVGHPAYVFGNDRLSCALCILASDNDIRNGAKHNPELAQHFLHLEEVGGSTFKNGKSLADILAGGDADRESGPTQLSLFDC